MSRQQRPRRLTHRSTARSLGRGTEEPKPSCRRGGEAPGFPRGGPGQAGSGRGPSPPAGSPSPQAEQGQRMALGRRGRAPRNGHSGGRGRATRPPRGRKSRRVSLAHLLRSTARPPRRQQLPAAATPPLLPPPAALTPPPALPAAAAATASSSSRRRRQFEGKSGCVTSSPARRRCG